MLRSLDVVALTRRVPMGFGNARHGCKSTEEHECEDDDSLHLDLTPSLSHPLRGRQPTAWRRAASNFGKNAQVRVTMGQPDVTEMRVWAAHERINVKRATAEEGKR